MFFRSGEKLLEMVKLSRISAALSHGEELEMATSGYVGKRSAMPLTTTFLNPVSGANTSVASALSSNKYHNETNVRPCVERRTLSRDESTV
jgi:hypothetical protein